MKTLIASVLAALLLTGCAAEKTVSDSAGATVTTATETMQSATTSSAVATNGEATASQSATAESQEPSTWAGQIKVGQPISMFNYVGAESGDFAPMRFRNDSAAGKKILAVCSNDDLCEFTGEVEWLDEVPPPDASAIGQIVRVDSVRRLPAAQ
jgi:hypothetical protein